MDERGLSIGAGIAEGVEKASANLFNIMVARDELRQKRELFGIQKKKGELDIKEAEFTTDPEIIKLRRDKFKADAKEAELDLDAKELLIKKTEEELRTDALLGVLSGTRQLGQMDPERAEYISGLGGPGVVDYGAPEFGEEEFAKGLREVLGVTRGEAVKEKLGLTEDLTEKEQFRKDLQEAIATKDFTTLERDYPDMLENIRPHKESITPLETKSLAVAGHFGLIARGKAGFAHMNAQTQAIAGKLKTQGDLRKLLEKGDKLKATGVKVDALLEYYTNDLMKMDL